MLFLCACLRVCLGERENEFRHGFRLHHRYHHWLIVSDALLCEVFNVCHPPHLITGVLISFLFCLLRIKDSFYFCQFFFLHLYNICCKCYVFSLGFCGNTFSSILPFLSSTNVPRSHCRNELSLVDVMCDVAGGARKRTPAKRKSPGIPGTPRTLLQFRRFAVLDGFIL